MLLLTACVSSTGPSALGTALYDDCACDSPLPVDVWWTVGDRYLETSGSARGAHALRSVLTIDFGDGPAYFIHTVDSDVIVLTWTFDPAPKALQWTVYALVNGVPTNWNTLTWP